MNVVSLSLNTEIDIINGTLRTCDISKWKAVSEKGKKAIKKKSPENENRNKRRKGKRGPEILGIVMEEVLLHELQEETKYELVAAHKNR